MEVDVDVSSYAPGGTVTATVSCLARLQDLSLGDPGATDQQQQQQHQDRRDDHGLDGTHPVPNLAQPDDINAAREGAGGADPEPQGPLLHLVDETSGEILGS